jgi:hypothetical protein
MSAERLRLLFTLQQKPQPPRDNALGQEEEESLHSASYFGISPTPRDNDNHDDDASWWDEEALPDEHALRRLRLGGEWAQLPETTRAAYNSKLPYRSKPHNDTAQSKSFAPTTSVSTTTRYESEGRPKRIVADKKA